MPRVPKLDHAMTATIARRTVRVGTKVLALLLVVEDLGSIVLQLFVVHLERVGSHEEEREREQTYPIWSTMPLTPPTSDSSWISVHWASTVQQARVQVVTLTPIALPDTTFTTHPTASVPHAVPGFKCNFLNILD